jgi:hypothetical protein
MPAACYTKKKWRLKLKAPTSAVKRLMMITAKLVGNSGANLHIKISTLTPLARTTGCLLEKSAGIYSKTVLSKHKTLSSKSTLFFPKESLENTAYLPFLLSRNDCGLR